MSPPEFKHLYIDNYWMELGKAMNNLHYLDNVIIEHMHYINKKAPKDDLYSVLNSSDMYSHDREEFQKLFNTDKFKNLIKKIWTIKLNMISKK